MPEASNKMDVQLLRRVLQLAKPFKKMFALAAILATLLAPVSILRPKLVQIMVDDYISVKDLSGLLNIAMIFVGVLVLEAILRYVFIYSTNLLGQLVIRDLRVRVFNHISKLKLTYFDRTPIGTSTTRTINDIETINQIFSQGAITIVADVLTVFAVLAVMLITSVKLTLVCLVTMPFLLWATYIFKEKVKTAYQKVRNKISEMNAFLQERITGMRIVQIFNAEQQEMSKFKKINRDYTQANLDSIFYYAVFFAVVEIISAAALGLMIWWGASSVLEGSVSVGALIAFPIYLSMLFRPLRMLADKFNQLQMGLVASERVFKLLDRTDFIDNKGTLSAEEIQGNIDFKNIWFAYLEDDYVLKGLSFSIKKGETLAIVGGTGSGKSTIINLLNRFYEINKGQIDIDGKSIKDYELYSLRRQIAVVLQDVFLFSGTVSENINLRDDSISRAEIIEAAKMIGAHEFIEKLPGGYDYEVMERGATLSMGQRQLISFVRALVFNPRILVLDEATSSIDPETESVIQYAIEKLIAKRTSIIIAHRLSTIRHANNILVLSKGKIQEFGSHEELLEIENGHYRDLYEMQFFQAAE
ncbi:MAG: ATP-binding cassette subfamily B multidrug efflux pump [Paraglaciecola sp.]|jgi:ATP-binding cassette subfamily B multidrug efflux pump